MIGFMICHTLGECSVTRVYDPRADGRRSTGYGALSSGSSFAETSWSPPSLVLTQVTPKNAGVSTVFVGLAEDPLILAERDPQLFEQIRRTYPKVVISVRSHSLSCFLLFLPPHTLVFCTSTLTDSLHPDRSKQDRTE